MPIRWCCVSVPQRIGVGLVVRGDPEPGRRPEQVGGAEPTPPVRAGLRRAVVVHRRQPWLADGAAPWLPQPSGLFW